MSYGFKAYDAAGKDINAITGQLLREIAAGGPTTLAGGAYFDIPATGNVLSYLVITSVPTILSHQRTAGANGGVLRIRNEGTTTRTFTWRVLYVISPVWS